MDIVKYANNEYVVAVLTIFAIVYASRAQLCLPKRLVSLFKNDIFKIVYLFLLLVVSFKTAPHVAMVVSVVFVVALNLINAHETNENFELIATKSAI